MYCHTLSRPDSLTIVCCLFLAFANHALVACPPDGWTRASLQQLKDADFSGLSTDRSTPLAFALIDRLDHPDPDVRDGIAYGALARSEEHTSELQSLMRISYAVFCLKKKKQTMKYQSHTTHRV